CQQNWFGHNLPMIDTAPRLRCLCEVLWSAFYATISVPDMSSSLLLGIANLASPGPAVRITSAAAIYNQRIALARTAISSWLANREFSLLVPEPPRFTVGLAVFPDSFVRIRQANGNPRLAVVPADLDAEEFELHFPTEISLDILTTRDPNGEGAIARYLKRFGEGIQQVEYRCDDVDRATAILKRDFGVASVYPHARRWADGTRVNFFLVPIPDGGKVLIELYAVPES